MKEKGELSLENIRARRLPGVGTGPGGSIVPIYTTEATGPEVTQYLVTAVDKAIELLRRARSSAAPELQAEIDGYIERT
jgi:hypothetical protein